MRKRQPCVLECFQCRETFNFKNLPGERTSMCPECVKDVEEFYKDHLVVWNKELEEEGGCF